MNDADLRPHIEPLRHQTGGIIKACHRVMHEFGFISQENAELIADVFNVSKAEVRGVISFYHDFRTSPQPAVRIRICQAEACQSMGSRKLTAEVEHYLGFSIGETPEDSQTAFEPVFCLGLCALGPAAEVGEKLVTRATLEGIKDAL